MRKLFFHNFFQGVGIAFFFTAANALFLQFYSVKWLPWVYLTSALLLFLFGRAYAHFEHHWSIKKLMTYVVATLFFVPLIFYSGLAVWQQAGLIFLLMAFHRVLYMLNSLEFWGLSALAFNVRQSKRTFPLIGAGDIPAKLLGYLAVSAIVPYTGIEALLLIASGAFLISFFFVQQLVKHHKNAFRQKSDIPDFSPKFETTKNWLPTTYFRSPFILWISLLSVVSLIALTLLDYAFLIEVKYSFKKKENLAQFFGLLFSFGYALILISKFLISGRMIERLGVVRSAFILPVFLSISSLLALTIGVFTSDPAILLWVYSAILIGVSIIRYSIDDPNLMTLFQPLSKSLRLHGHTLVKTIMNPLGLLIAGSGLLLILYATDAVNLTLISAILLVFSLAMILIAFKVRKHYLQQLFHAVRTRYFEGSALSISSPKALQFLEQKIATGTEGEAIHSLKLLSQNQPKHWSELLSSAIQHQGEQVKTYAISLARQEPGALSRGKLLQILKNEKSPSVLQAAIYALPEVVPEKISLLYNFIENENPVIQATAIRALLSSEQLEAETKAGQIVLKLIKSEDPKDLIFACNLLQQIEKKNNYPLLLPLFKSQYPEVVSAAIQTAGKMRHPSLHSILWQVFDKNPSQPNLLSTLAAYSNQNLTDIQNRLSNDENSIIIDRQLCLLLAKIGTSNALKLLFNELNHTVAEMRSFVVRLLYRSSFSLDENNEKQFAFYCDRWISKALRLLFAEEKYKNFAEIASAFHWERKNKIEEVLMLLSCKYGRKKFKRIIDSLSLGNPDRLATALEMLEYELPRSLFRPIESMLDPSFERDRLHSIKKGNPELQGIENIQKDILKNHWKDYSRWTVAVTLKYIKNRAELLPYVESLKKHNSALIQEQAFNALNRDKNAKSMDPTTNQNGALLQIEKIILLKNTNLFQNIPESILVDVADILQEIECAASEVLFKKGELGTKMYIIAQGSIRIHDENHTFSTLETHQIFGELALLSPEPRSASATATEDSLLLCIEQDPFFELISTHSEVNKGVIQRLAELLRKQNEEIVQLRKRL